MALSQLWKFLPEFAFKHPKGNSVSCLQSAGKAILHFFLINKSSILGIIFYC